MELMASEIKQRISQEGSIDYVLLRYYQSKDLKKIKNKELRDAAIELLYCLEEFEDILEDAVLKELMEY